MKTLGEEEGHIKKLKVEPQNSTDESNHGHQEKGLKVVFYKHCRKNHAANIGKYAVDGCCEFMPAGEAGSNSALLCAACGCHRNFHAKVVLQCHHQTYYCDDCSSLSATNTPK